MRAEHEQTAFGNLGQVIVEDGAFLAERVDDVAVVHDLVTYVDRGSVDFESEFDDLDGAVYPGAESPRARQEQAGHGASLAARFPGSLQTAGERLTLSASDTAT